MVSASSTVMARPARNIPPRRRFLAVADLDRDHDRGWTADAGGHGAETADRGSSTPGDDAALLSSRRCRVYGRTGRTRHGRAQGADTEAPGARNPHAQGGTRDDRPGCSWPGRLRTHRVPG